MDPADHVVSRGGIAVLLPTPSFEAGPTQVFLVLKREEAPSLQRGRRRLRSRTGSTAAGAGGRPGAGAARPGVRGESWRPPSQSRGAGSSPLSGHQGPFIFFPVV